MAESKLLDVSGKVAARHNVLLNLQLKLHNQLESDLSKLLLHCNYFDLELVVDSESVFGHSCILRTRAARFYSYITTQCFSSRTNVVTTVYIENVSVVYIRKFIETIYSSTFLPDAETYVLKYLENTKINEKVNRSKTKILSPDSETFFTPKSSPSELYKPFTLINSPNEEISVSRRQNNATVQSYYRIVSVEDILAKRLDTPLEKELAEQDELFKSLKCISSKKKCISKPSSLPLSRRTPWKDIKEPNKRLPSWRPKVFESEHQLLRTPVGSVPKVQKSSQVYMMSNSPEVNVSSATTDSGLDLSAIPMDTSTDEPITEPNMSENESRQDFNVPIESPLEVEQDLENKKNLGEADLARLDAMEKNMKDCEDFLTMEKNAELKSRQKEFSGNKFGGPASLPTVCTPPCSPRVSVSSESCWKPSSSSSFFIDASSLLDDDEVSSPPLSLPASSLVTLSNGNYDDEKRRRAWSTTDCDAERRQGEMIFKTSIPHYSRHEIDYPQRSVGSCETDFESEQVVPVVNTSSLQYPYESCVTVTGADSQYPARVALDSDREGRAFVPAPSPATTSSSVSSKQVDVPSNLISSKQLTPPPESRQPNTCDGTPIPYRKISGEKPIISGGASPKDFFVRSNSSSPHLPRRHELVPIISGGMDLPVCVEKKVEKRSHPNGEVWVVDIGPSKTNDRQLLRGASSEPESESATKEETLPKVTKDCKSPVSKNSSPMYGNVEDGDKSFPIEKSASLGYFFDFGSCEEATPITKPKKPHRNDSSNLKKNMFSMFIDINDEKRDNSSDTSFKATKLIKEGSSDSETTMGRDSDGTEPRSADSKATNKKPHYMFIEAESPEPKKHISSRGYKQPHSTLRRPPVAMTSSDTGNEDFSLESVDSRRSNVSSERASEDRDVWNWDNSGQLGTWHSRNGHTELADATAAPASAPAPTVTAGTEHLFKKDSTFIIDGIQEKFRAANTELHTVIESTPPKSPIKNSAIDEDSGVVATEESDDSFVRLSDMDNTTKNPYMEPVKRRQEGQKSAILDTAKRRHVARMSQSIPEGGWQLKRPSRIPEREKPMSRSIGGAGSGGDSDIGALMPVSKSISRLFPHLSGSTLSLARTHTTDVSEHSSMLSSFDPCGLDVSTSETEVSCQGDGAARLGQDLLRMFLEEMSPDVVVEVGGRRIKAHKCILSSRCQYFAAMLSGGWVESAGNVISLQGFSYAAVHFALCHIYCGESEVPDSLNIVELATLADMLCLEGLKEVISYTLRVKYCHSFHSPCSSCVVGVLDCMPVASDYGLDDLYRKCLRWTSKFLVKVWPSKAFAGLRKEHIDKCLQYHIIHMTTDNVLDTLLCVDKVRGSLPSIRWAETVTKAVNKLQDAAVRFIAEHFSSILTSDQFLALGKDSEWSIERVEGSLMQAASRLSPEQACWSHARMHSLITLATSPHPPEQMLWNETFIMLLSRLSEDVQNSLIKQAPRAARSKAWQQMEPELRSFIEEAACLVLPSNSINTNRRATPKGTAGGSLPSSLRSSTRASDLRQVKLTMTQQVSRTSKQVAPLRRPAPLPLSRNVPEAPKRIEVRKSQSTSAVREPAGTMAAVTAPRRFTEVKSRYMQPRSPRKTVIDNNNQKRNGGISSSDSSRNCSPAMARAASANPAAGKPTRKPAGGGAATVRSASSTIVTRPLTQLAADDNMSTDSLATESSCGEKDIVRKHGRGKENTRVERPRATNHKLIAPPPRKTQSLSAFPPPVTSVKPKTMIPRMESDNKKQWRRPMTAAADVRPAAAKSKGPQSLTQRNKAASAKITTNGNVDSHPVVVDAENNSTATAFRPPAFVSRSGTFLKDEPTILKKPQAHV